MILFLNFLNYLKIKNKEDLICFYSESSFYTNFYIELALKLKGNDKNNVLLLTSNINEYENLKNNFNTIFIGSGFYRYLIFNILTCSCLITTLTDIGNNLFKSRFCKKYIYYFHAMASTHKIYTSTAFDNYDVIFALGKFHTKEIRLREKKFNLKEKKIYEIGYFYLDYLKKNTDKNRSKDNVILFAPSWNYNDKNLLNDHAEHIVKELISKNFKVIFRPHPENLKKNNKVIKVLEKKYSSEMFILDRSSSNINSMELSGSLLTDNSAISLEFSFNFYRPVFFINYSDKIHNKNFNDMDILPIEDIFKKEIGFSMDLSEINQIQNYIKKFYENKVDNKNKIDHFFYKYYCNIGDTAEKGKNLIEEIIKQN